MQVSLGVKWRVAETERYCVGWGKGGKGNGKGKGRRCGWDGVGTLMRGGRKRQRGRDRHRERNLFVFS